MKAYINNFTKYSYLLGELVKKDIKLKYRRSALGILWTLIEPLLTTLVLAVVFGGLRGKTDAAFPVYILTGRLLYSYFSNATKAATKSIRTNSGMIKKVYVPKYIYPLLSILSNYIIFLISMIVLVGVTAVCRVPITWHILEALIPLFLILVMATGVGLILATIAVFFRDMEYLWGVILMLIMYCCAIFYDPIQVTKNGYQWIFDWNPLYALILNFRNAVLYGQGPDMHALVYSICVSFGSLLVGVILFYKKQDDFILNI